jgi:protein gp37
LSTGIEWTNETWNPVTGCSKVSPGCAHCYAEGVAARFWPTQYPPVEYDSYSVDACCPITEMRPREFTDVQCHEDRLGQPLRWRKPRKVFVNSMSDLFHENVPDAFIDEVFAVMALAPQHTFQVLTKRAERMRDYMTTLSKRSTGSEIEGMIPRLEMAAMPAVLGVPGIYSLPPWPLRNAWLGVSVENQHFADERIPLLLETPAAVRFLSCEPLLSRLDLSAHLGSAPHHDDLRGLLNWVIVGGESGPSVRPTKPEWVQSVRDQCVEAGVPFFFKQWGGRTAKAGGRLLDGREWNEMPTVL